MFLIAALPILIPLIAMPFLEGPILGNLVLDSLRWRARAWATFATLAFIASLLTAIQVGLVPAIVLAFSLILAGTASVLFALAFVAVITVLGVYLLSKTSGRVLPAFGHILTGVYGRSFGAIIFKEGMKAGDRGDETFVFKGILIGLLIGTGGFFWSLSMTGGPSLYEPFPAIALVVGLGLWVIDAVQDRVAYIGKSALSPQTPTAAEWYQKFISRFVESAADSRTEVARYYRKSHRWKSIQSANWTLMILAFLDRLATEFGMLQSTELGKVDSVWLDLDSSRHLVALEHENDPNVDKILTSELPKLLKDSATLKILVTYHPGPVQLASEGPDKKAWRRSFTEKVRSQVVMLTSPEEIGAEFLLVLGDDMNTRPGDWRGWVLGLADASSEQDWRLLN